MAAFSLTRPVRFRDCDPAGIVFYPRYFEMINDLVETFFDEGVGWSFATMHGEDGVGVPTGEISARFSAPSRLGEVLEWQLVVVRIGGASAGIRVTATGGGVLRLTAEATLVHVDLEAMKSTRWPAEIRARLGEYGEEDAA